MWVAELRAHEQLEIREVWRLVCESIQELRVDTETVSGLTIGTPLVRNISFDGLDGPPVLLVELRPGMLIGDLTEHSARFATAMGCRSMRAELAGLDYPVGSVWVRFTVGPDPLAAAFAPAELLAGPNGHVVWGRGEDGSTVSMGLHGDSPHVVAQGQTGSGKSTWVYGVLGQLAGRPDVVVAGSDPTGLLWRPWPASPLRVGGLRDPQVHEAMLARLIAEMDDRLDAMPALLDKSPTGPDLPVIVVVLEEYAGLLRAADQADPKLGKAIRSHVGRLLAESRKVGFRVLMLVQRAEASIIGGAERSNLAGRVSFRVDGRDSVKLLHGPDVPEDVVSAHMRADAGVALFEAPGLPLGRLRAPLSSYGDYVATVTAGDPGGPAPGCRPPGLPSLIK